MKLSFSFLCGVLVYSAICCVNVAAEDSNEIGDMKPASKVKFSSYFQDVAEACTVDYLKRKGKLNAQFTSDAPPFLVCRFVMQLSDAVARSLVYNLLESKFPDDVNCLMREYGKNHNYDVYLAIIMTEKAKSLTAAERIASLNNLHNELKEQMKEAATECKVEEGKFLEKFSELFRDMSDDVVTETETV